MKDKILALLTAKFAGVRKDGLAQLALSLSLQAENEDEATALVEKLTSGKVTDFVKDWRKDVDKEVSDSNKTFEGNLKKKYDFVEKKGTEPGKDPIPTDPGDIATIVANAVKAAVEPIQQKLSSFEGERVSQSRLQQLQAKFTGKKLPESFTAQKIKDFQRMNFSSDQEFADYLIDTDKDITAFSQELADQGLAGHARPILGSPNKDGISPAVSSYIEKKAEPEKNLGGREV